MPARENNPVQKSVPGQPYQDQEEVVPCIEQDLQGLPASVGRSGEANEKQFSVTYNLKKYLKFEQRRSKSGAGNLALAALAKSILDYMSGDFIKRRKLVLHT